VGDWLALVLRHVLHCAALVQQQRRQQLRSRPIAPTDLRPGTIAMHDCKPAPLPACLRPCLPCLPACLPACLFMHRLHVFRLVPLILSRHTPSPPAEVDGEVSYLADVGTAPSAAAGEGRRMHSRAASTGSAASWEASQGAQPRSDSRLGGAGGDAQGAYYLEASVGRMLAAGRDR
jgi:hypothetical protein